MPLPPLLDGPVDSDKQTTPTERNQIANIGHYLLPDDIEVQLEPLFQQLGIKPHETSVLVTSDVVPTETIIPPTIVPNSSVHGDSGEVGVVSLSVSVIVLMIGTVVFSTLIASLVAVVVAKLTSSRQKELIQQVRVLVCVYTMKSCYSKLSDMQRLCYCSQNE